MMTRSMSTIVALDIDGVLLPGRAFKLKGNEQLLNFKLPEMTRMELAVFQPEAIVALSKLLSEAQAKLIVISSWRRAWVRRQGDLKQKLISQGVPVEAFHDHWFVACNTDLPLNKPADLQSWLLTHDWERLILLDDQPPLYDEVISLWENKERQIERPVINPKIGWL